jgi:hypothetical protein
MNYKETESGITALLDGTLSLVSGGAKVEENWRFEIPVAAA